MKGTPMIRCADYAELLDQHNAHVSNAADSIRQQVDRADKAEERADVAEKDVAAAQQRAVGYAHRLYDANDEMAELEKQRDEALARVDHLEKWGSDVGDPIFQALAELELVDLEEDDGPEAPAQRIRDLAADRERLDARVSALRSTLEQIVRSTQPYDHLSSIARSALSADWNRADPATTDPDEKDAAEQTTRLEQAYADVRERNALQGDRLAKLRQALRDIQEDAADVTVAVDEALKADEARAGR